MLVSNFASATSWSSLSSIQPHAYWHILDHMHICMGMGRTERLYLTKNWWHTCTWHYYVPMSIYCIALIFCGSLIFWIVTPYYFREACWCPSLYILAMSHVSYILCAHWLAALLAKTGLHSPSSNVVVASPAEVISETMLGMKVLKNKGVLYT